MSRLTVRKTYKLFINGDFVRSESGRSFELQSADGRFAANVAHASRKDARDAVRAARAAQPGWSSCSGYLRGQILYRAAEMLEGRRVEMEEALVASGFGRRDAASHIDEAIDRFVHYAGWADKLGQLAGTVNDVSGPFFNVSQPEPVGVVATLAPSSSLVGLVEVVCAAVVSGNTSVVTVDRGSSVVALSLAEVLATSDLPCGVVNILTGDHAELGPVLAAHRDVDAIDLVGAGAAQLQALAKASTGNLKRVLLAGTGTSLATVGNRRMLALLETKTIWHTVGS